MTQTPEEKELREENDELKGMLKNYRKAYDADGYEKLKEENERLWKLLEEIRDGVCPYVSNNVLCGCEIANKALEGRG